MILKHESNPLILFKVTENKNKFIRTYLRNLNRTAKDRLHFLLIHQASHRSSDR